MPRSKLTSDERIQSQRLVHQLAEHYPGGWDKLMVDAQVPSTTAHSWRYGKKPVTPASSHLLRMLRASGVLTSDLLVPGMDVPANWEVLKAQRDAEDAKKRAAALPRRKRTKPAQDGTATI